MFPQGSAQICIYLILLTLACLTQPARAQQDLSQREQQAFRQAIERVAPSIVRIETIGGRERSGRILFGTGPTTGLVLTADGYLISSAFNFAARPNSILITLADGRRTAAELVATDHNRMLTLLKVDLEKPLIEPEIVPAEELRVGQWAIAAGRTFDSSRPSMSVGIVSALSRVWGKAIQTDAKVSPNNYGGPLIDIEGRVMGVLVPLSPDSSSEVAGIQWYDSGIGFAIPFEHVRSMLPRLSEGEDLFTGILGVSLRGRNQFADPPLVTTARINSPAYHAGIKAGDRIVEIDDESIATLVDLRGQLRRRYAGDTVRVVVERGDERLERDIELVARLEPYVHPFLGILPRREGAEESAGVAVRYVFPQSPASVAAIESGDSLIALGSAAITDRDDLTEKLAALAPGETIRFTIQRGEEELVREVRLGSLPDSESASLPDDLPPARERFSRVVDDLPRVGNYSLQLPEFKNTALLYVPEDYDPQVTYGLVVWHHATGGLDENALLARWKPLCDANDLILVAPKSADPSKWLPTEIEFIRKAVEEVRTTYRIDPSRIVAGGFQSGGSMAYILAFADRDTIRAVVAVDAALVIKPGDNDPLRRLSFYAAGAKNARLAKQISAGIERLRGMQYPMTVVELSEPGRDLNEAELNELIRWIDTRDRI